MDYKTACYTGHHIRLSQSEGYTPLTFRYAVSPEVGLFSMQSM